MSDYVNIPTPAAWHGLCERHPEFRLPGSEPARVELTADRHAELCEIHNEIDSTCPWNHDFLIHGAMDYWTPATPKGGDCEDLALAKQRAAVARGWDPASFALVLCKGRNGRFDETEFDHAVLAVFTDGGLVVLDNRMRIPAAMPDLTRDLSYLSGYRWLSRSDPTGEWVSLEEGRGSEETGHMHPDIRALNEAWLKQRYSRS